MLTECQHASELIDTCYRHELSHPFRVVVKRYVSIAEAMEALFDTLRPFAIDGLIFIDVKNPYRCSKDPELLKVCAIHFDTVLIFSSTNRITPSISNWLDIPLAEDLLSASCRRISCR
jgi:hypothetical protein